MLTPIHVDLYRNWPRVSWWPKFIYGWDGHRTTNTIGIAIKRFAIFASVTVNRPETGIKQLGPNNIFMFRVH